MMSLYDDEQSTTRKFTSLVICYGYAPTTTGNVMVLQAVLSSLQTLLRVNSVDKVDLIQASSVVKQGNIRFPSNSHCPPTPFWSYNQQ